MYRSTAISVSVCVSLSVSVSVQDDGGFLPDIAYEIPVGPLSTIMISEDSPD